MKLDGQVAIVVGSARGIGETIAHTFAQEGASIVLVDLEKMKPQLDGVAQEITRKGGRAIAIVADCTDNRQVNAMVDETVRRWGKIDILVNSAGLRGNEIKRSCDCVGGAGSGSIAIRLPRKARALCSWILKR